MSDTAILTLNDFERIKKNSKFITKEEENNNLRILNEQHISQQAKTNSLKERLMSYDKRKVNKYDLTDMDKENIEKKNDILNRAKQILENNEDSVKEMNHFVLYAKIASIRDKQLQEHKTMSNVFKKKEEKQDIMMEVERLKELKNQEERERKRKIEQREGALIIIDQIKEREMKRIKAKEQIKKEGEEIVKKIIQFEEEDKRQIEKKKAHDEQMAKEIEISNRNAAMTRDKKKSEEKELDLKILRYNMVKAKKEEDELAERKRLRDEKEKETQRLREKQEKFQDKQLELDGLRAKRAFEDEERKLREKTKQEIIKRRKLIDDLLLSNEKQKIDKELKLGEQAKQEQDEYERIIRNQLAELEEEKKRDEEKRKMRYDHNLELRRQIKTREEFEKMLKRAGLEEGRSIKQNNEKYKARLEEIKQEKLKELQSLNIDEKYIVDLERYKIN